MHNKANNKKKTENDYNIKEILGIFNLYQSHGLVLQNSRSIMIHGTNRKTKACLPLLDSLKDTNFAMVNIC